MRKKIKSKIKTNSEFIILINSIKKDCYISLIKKEYLTDLTVPEFNVITLPESGLEFLKKVSISCLYCQRKNLSSILCLKRSLLILETSMFDI